MKRQALLITLTVLLAGLSTAQTTISSNTIALQVMSTEPSPMQIGQYADVRFKVTNLRPDGYENVTVSFEENYPFSVDSDNEKRWRIASLESGDSYEFRMQVRVDPNALQGQEEMEFKVSTGQITRKYEIPVQIKADDDGLVIDNVEFPEEIGAGTSSVMNITLRNTANAYFRNIELGVTPSATTPVVVSGTSTRRVSRMAPENSKTLHYKLNVGESAENGVYSIPLHLEYENEAGTTLTRKASTGIVIGGKPRIEVGLNGDGEIKAGMTGAVNFRFVNRGKGTAKFVKVNVEESKNYTIRSGSSVYLGDMNPDDYQTAETTLYTEPGTDSITVPVEVVYRENGVEKKMETSVEVNVLTPQEIRKYGLGGGSPLLPAVVITLVLAAGIYYWRRKKQD
ncbi:MAG: COG1361 S-layer family protein [Candidatus Nanohaloarchaea archaeon]